jgi:hypothetical protein
LLCNARCAHRRSPQDERFMSISGRNTDIPMIARTTMNTKH